MKRVVGFSYSGPENTCVETRGLRDPCFGTLFAGNVHSGLLNLSSCVMQQSIPPLAISGQKHATKSSDSFPLRYFVQCVGASACAANEAVIVA